MRALDSISNALILLIAGWPFDHMLNAVEVW